MDNINNISLKPTKGEDRFSARYALMPAACIFSTTICSAADMIGIGVLVVIALLCWLPTAILLTLIAAWRRLWKKVLSRVATFALLLPLFYIASALTDYIHLAIIYYRHSDSIAASTTSGLPAEFHWKMDEGFAGWSGYKRTLVYDPKGIFGRQVENPNKEPLDNCMSYRRLFREFFIFHECI